MNGYTVRFTIWDGDHQTLVSKTTSCADWDELAAAKSLTNDLFDSVLNEEFGKEFDTLAEPMPGNEKTRYEVTQDTYRPNERRYGQHGGTRPYSGNTAAPARGVKGITFIRCTGCGQTFVAYLKEKRETYRCRNCNEDIDLTWTKPYSFECQSCEKSCWGRTNIQDGEIEVPCVCGDINTLRWSERKRMYLGLNRD